MVHDRHLIDPFGFQRVLKVFPETVMGSSGKNLFTFWNVKVIASLVRIIMSNLPLFADPRKIHDLLSNSTNEAIHDYRSGGGRQGVILTNHQTDWLKPVPW